MNVSVSKLGKALATVKAVASKRTTLPILNCIHVSGDDGRLTLKASNLDCTVEMSVEAAGSLTPICVPAKLFSSMATRGTEEVEIESDGSRMKVCFGNGQADIAGLPADDFPTDIPGNLTALNLDPVRLADAIGHVTHGVSTDETRYALNGVHVEADNGKVHVVASDGVTMTADEFDGEGKCDIIIPIASVPMVREALNLPGAKLAVDERFIRVAHDAGFVSARLIDGQFPNWRQVVPGEHKFSCKADCVALESVVSGALPLLTDKCFSVKLEFNGDGLNCSARNPDHGEYRATVPGKFKPLAIAINPNFLLRTLREMDGEITIEAVDCLNPLVIRKDSLLAVISLMRMSR